MIPTRTPPMRLCAVALLAALTGWLCPLAYGQSYEWKPVTIKGGGLVTGVITHPAVPNVIYCRTDVGGAYRWQNSANRWVPLLDFVGYSDPNLIGVESLALDPADANRVYLACQAYTGKPAVIFRSTDMGATFTRFNVPFQMGGNADGRTNGERLRVDPNKSNILFFGSRLDGLWKSTDFGATWAQVTTFPVTTTANGNGLVFVEFVTGSGTAGNATPTIFVGVSRPTSEGANLYRSTDAGATWNAVATGVASTQMPHRAAQDGVGKMYLTFCDHEGPNNVSTGSVWKLDLATLASTNVTPPSIPAGAQGGFAGVSVDRQNPARLVVSTMDRWWAPSPLPPWDTIYLSTNGGASWTVAGPTSTPASSSAPWSSSRNPHWAGDVQIDPFNSNRAFFITGYGINACTNLTAADSGGTVNWAFTDDGMEETVPFEVKSPPSGALVLSALGDIGGFQHYDLDTSPPLANYVPHPVSSPSVDFAGANPAVLARTFQSSPYGGYSLDSGASWQDFSASPPTAAANGSGNIAVAADGSRFVWNPWNSIAYWSTNGATWTACTGCPSGSLTPLADRVNAAKFYICTGGSMYVSTNGGVSFAQAAAVPGALLPCAVPGHEGHLWVPCSGSANGLWRTTDSGATFAQVSAGVVQEAHSVGVGKAAPGQSYPAVFIFGKISNTWGLYRSDDEGASWVRINDDQHQYGVIGSITGDMRTYGRLYITTGGAGMGRGILYGDIPDTSTVPAAPSGLVGSMPEGHQINLEWNDNSTAETGFKIERSTDGVNFAQIGAVGTGTTFFLSTGLAPGTTYYHRLRAYNAAGNSAYSNIVSATTPAGPPAAPAGLTATANNEQVSLDWTATAGATSYRVKRATSSGGPYTLVASPSSPAAVDTYLVNTTMYFYVVSAVNDFGEGANSAEVSATPMPAIAKLSGTIIGSAGSFNNSGNDKTKLFDGSLTSYYDAANASGDWGGIDTGAGGAVITQVKYCPRTGLAFRMNGGRFEGANAANFSDAVTLFTISASPTESVLTAQPISNATAFRYVRYIGPSNGWCNAAEIEFWGWTTGANLPPAPTGLVATPGNTQVALTWDLAAGPSTYSIKRSASSSGPFTPVITGLTGTTFTDTGLTNNTQVFYVVSATNFAGEGANSGAIAATPHMSYADFQQQYFTPAQIADPLISGPGADPNGDGESNFMEFATAQDPLAGTAVASALVIKDTDLEFTYTRAKNALSDGVTFNVEWRDSLTSGVWSSGGVTEQILSDNGTVQTVRATVAAGIRSRFLHLRVAK